MDKFYKPQFELTSEKGNKATLVVHPLERGFATTIGNSLRRVLLSSIPGISAYAIQVKGAVHEFVALKGVKEDLTTIILNLKGIIYHAEEGSFNEDEDIVVKLTSTDGNVIAGDIKCPAGLTIVNKDHYIAHVTTKNALEIDIFLRKGRGYKTFQENKNINKLSGLIAIDSIFSPIINVNFYSEPTKIGKEKEFEKLFLEITTNGSVVAKEALGIAAKIIVGHYELLAAWSTSTEAKVISFDEEVKTSNQIPDEPIENLELTARTYNSLKKAGIRQVKELLNFSVEELNNIKALGKKSIEELSEIIAKKGLNFREDN